MSPAHHACVTGWCNTSKKTKSLTRTITVSSFSGIKMCLPFIGNIFLSLRTSFELFHKYLVSNTSTSYPKFPFSSHSHPFIQHHVQLWSTGKSQKTPWKIWLSLLCKSLSNLGCSPSFHCIFSTEVQRPSIAWARTSGCFHLFKNLKWANLYPLLTLSLLMPTTQGDTKIHVIQYLPFCLVVGWDKYIYWTYIY